MYSSWQHLEIPFVQKSSDILSQQTNAHWKHQLETLLDVPWCIFGSAQVRGFSSFTVHPFHQLVGPCTVALTMCLIDCTTMVVVHGCVDVDIHYGFFQHHALKMCPSPTSNNHRCGTRVRAAPAWSFDACALATKTKRSHARMPKVPEEEILRWGRGIKVGITGLAIP